MQQGRPFGQIFFSWIECARRGRIPFHGGAKYDPDALSRVVADSSDKVVPSVSHPVVTPDVSKFSNGGDYDVVFGPLVAVDETLGDDDEE